MSIGTRLREAREQAGLSVAEVAETTRIRMALIAGIESDDFSPCGGDAYARGHIRSLARAYGLEADATVAAFDAQIGRPAATPTAPATSGPVLEPERRVALAPVRSGPNWSMAMLVALLAVLGIGVWGWLGNRGPSPAGTVAAPPSAPASPGPTRTTRPSPAPSPTTTPTTRPTRSPDAIASRDSVEVVIAVAGRASWVRATGAGGRTLYEGTLERGDTRTLTDKTGIRLIIGNAGAVNLTVNGRDLGAPGGNGQVVRASFGPGDPTTAGA